MSSTRGRLAETWVMARVKWARQAETLKQPSRVKHSLWRWPSAGARGCALWRDGCILDLEPSVSGITHGI